jgi:hypothetical protein
MSEAISLSNGELLLPLPDFTERIKLSIYGKRSMLSNLQSYRLLLETLEMFLTENNFDESQDDYEDKFCQDFYTSPKAQAQELNLCFYVKKDEVKVVKLIIVDGKAFITDLFDFNILRVVCTRSKNYFEKNLGMKSKDYT